MKQLKLRFQQPSHDAKRYQPNINMQERRAFMLAIDCRPFAAVDQGVLPFVDQDGIALPAMISGFTETVGANEYLQDPDCGPKPHTSEQPLPSFALTDRPIIIVCDTLEFRHPNESRVDRKVPRSGFQRNPSRIRRRTGGTRAHSRRLTLDGLSCARMNWTLSYKFERTQMQTLGFVIADALQVLISLGILLCLVWRT